MKTKKIVVASCLILVLFAIFATPAFAVWANCNVIKVGNSGATNMAIRLKACDGTFTGERWYYLSVNIKKEMLAEALTAMSNGWQVYVNLTAITSYSTVTSMYVSKTAECP